jgi:hypothetical protein
MLDRNSTLQADLSNVFAPFDQVQLRADVAYGDVPHAGMLVSFRIQGPSGSVDPVNITRIVTTDETGVAAISLRLPAENQSNDSLVGTWQAYATIQTIAGPIQKTLTFTTSWFFKIDSLTLLNSKGHTQLFPQGSTVTAHLNISCTLPSPQTFNVSVIVQDASKKIFNQTQILNLEINSSGANQIQSDFAIPIIAALGSATCNATVTQGSLGDAQIQASENMSISFTIGPASTEVTSSFAGIFPWILLLTGVLSFTLLLSLFRRRHKNMNEQKPKFAPTFPQPAIQMQAFVQSTALEKESQRSEEKSKPLISQNQLPNAASALMPKSQHQPLPRIAQSKYAKATITTEIAQTPALQTRTEKLEPPQPQQLKTESPLETDLREEKLQPAPQSTVESIEILTKRIQYLKSEKQQIMNNLTSLREKADAQAKSLENEIKTLKEETEGLKPLMSENIEQIPETPKQAISRVQPSVPDLKPEIASEVARTFEEEVKLIEAGYEYVTEINETKIFKRKHIYTSKEAKTIEETRRLIEDDFEYVTEVSGTKIFRKPEQFTLQIARSIEEARVYAEAGYDCVGELDGAKIFRKKKIA